MGHNILVTGANGQLGKCLRDAQKELYKLGGENTYYYCGHSDLDITKPDSIEKYIDEHHIDVIVNCAAYTKVEDAETEEGMAMAERINHFAVRNIATIGAKKGCNLILIGTDYFYDNRFNTPITESSSPMQPLNIYGKTKFNGLIDATLEYNETENKIISITTSWLYSKYGRNFVTRFAEWLAKGEIRSAVIDETGSPTYAPDLARLILKIIEDELWPQHKGDNVRLLNFANFGTASRYDLAMAIKRAGNYPGKVLPTDSGGFDSMARRPKYSVLDSRNVSDMIPKFQNRHWEDALIECIEEIEKQKRES